MFLAYFRQFKIRRMFTLPLPPKLTEEATTLAWGWSHLKANEILLLLEGGHSFYLHYKMSQNYIKVQSLKKNLVKKIFKTLTPF